MLTGPSAAALKKSSRYWPLKPMAMGSPLYSFSMVSLASPYSGLEAEISMPSWLTRKFHRMRALIGELRDAPHGVVQFVALEYHQFIVVARQYRFVIGELPGQNT